MGGLIVLKQMSVIAILVGIGIWLQKRDVLNDKSTPFLSRIVVDICNPALIVSSIVSGNISVTHEDFLKGVWISAAVYFFFIILGYALPHIIRIPKDERKFYSLMSIYGNVGFLGIPVAKAILPENAMLYVIICNVFYCLLFYTHGIITLSSGREKMDLKKLISPGVIMSILALPKTILMVIVTLIPVAIIYFIERFEAMMWLMPLTYLFWFSLPAYACAKLYDKTFKRFEPEAAQASDDMAWTVSATETESEGEGEHTEETSDENVVADSGEEPKAN